MIEITDSIDANHRGQRLSGRHSQTRAELCLWGSVFIPNMSSPKTHSLRVVVQHSRVNQQSSYRLVVYGGQGGDYISGSAVFESLDRLLKALHSVAPDLDENALSIRKTLETYIAFAGEMKLDDSQLSLLGLKDGTKS